ncbi:unnamed protein product [Pleuronectes platessa]|uniref:Uncharacterized protein n=1 Tax=Pleuronectes platessa TaxID=8262 RepID=A0A9N7UJ72_PLEPL|nr:unnamed protein product [Pleuronectes platessa]
MPPVSPRGGHAIMGFQTTTSFVLPSCVQLQEPLMVAGAAGLEQVRLLYSSDSDAKNRPSPDESLNVLMVFVRKVSGPGLRLLLPVNQTRLSVGCSFVLQPGI